MVKTQQAWDLVRGIAHKQENSWTTLMGTELNPDGGAPGPKASPLHNTTHHLTLGWEQEAIWEL